MKKPLLALALAHDRGEQHEALAARARHDRVHHLGDGLRFERHPVVRAARLAGAREEQPQVVVDLGDGPDRRARVVGGGFLLDGDRRRQPLDSSSAVSTATGEACQGTFRIGIHGSPRPAALRSPPA